MSWLGNLFGGHAPAGYPIPEGALLVDVRSPAEYAGGHLQGACLMPLPQLAQDMATLCSDLSRPVVVYCAAGVRSASAVDQLRELGYQQVINGGSIGRLALASGLPVVRGPEGH